MKLNRNRARLARGLLFVEIYRHNQMNQMKTTRQLFLTAAICALAMENEWLPPTVNLDAPDAACALDHVPRTGLSGAPEHILSNSFGFGGINAALVLRRAD